MSTGTPLPIGVERTPYGEVEADLAPVAHNSLALHLSGRCTLEWAAGGRPLVGRPARGDVTLIPAGRSGRLRVRGGGCKVLKIAVPDEALRSGREANAAASERPGPIGCFVQRDPLVQEIGLALLAETERPGTVDSLYRDALSNALVAHLVKRHSDAPSVGARAPAGQGEGRARRALAFMEADLARTIGLGDIARELGLSTSHFAAQFRTTFGQSPARYLTWLRLERARLLLTTTEDTVAEISAAVGFATPSHFSHAFRQAFGVTPSQLRSR